MTAHGGDCERVADLLEQAAAFVMRNWLDRVDLSLTAADVLHRLGTDGPARLSTLASKVQISQPSMTQLVQRLELRGLVKRRPDPCDRRATLVTMTDAGRTLLQTNKRRGRDRLDRLIAALPAETQAALQLAANVALPIIQELKTVDSAHGSAL
jgi:DNA-binding MarR family transcriptional regulator